ncbi:MAG: hypothetical protein ACE5H4_09245 [Candidatus Thorarchaeota archaeon]
MSLGGLLQRVNAMESQKRGKGGLLSARLDSGRLNVLSKRRSGKTRTRRMSEQAYLDRVCDLSRRGSMDAIAELMKGYWKDKKAHPWHRLYKILDNEWKRTHEKDSVTEKLMLLREGVFGALGILSLSLPLNTPTERILQVLTRAKSWKEGRRNVRTECAKIVSDMISSRDVAHLIPSALQRDGYGFLTADLSEALLEDLRRAEPKARKGSVSLGRLAKSVLGRRLLEEQMIHEKKIPEKDPRFSPLSQAYDQLLLKMELEETSALPRNTLQITLNGQIVQDIAEARYSRYSTAAQEGVQSSLTEYLKANQKKKRRSPVKKKKPSRGRKKRSTKGGKK